MRLPSRLLAVAAYALLALGVSRPSFASDVPAWLAPHVGVGEGQIAPVVLERARALYRRKGVRNPCYFAMDATRPHDAGGGSGRRFYVICEAQQAFRAISAGHGGGRDLAGLADFSNGRRCGKHFGNAMDSELTAGGDYVTGETKESFKGYYRAGQGDAPFVRTFVVFDGEGETSNARDRAIGGHAAMLLAGLCRRKAPGDPHADSDGYVRFGKLVNYAAGRSDGCTSWSPADAQSLVALVRGAPTTLYIYPESRDIVAVAAAVAGGQSLSRLGLYWNAACLKDIGAPKFWPRETLEPIIARYREAHPAPPPRRSRSARDNESRLRCLPDRIAVRWRTTETGRSARRPGSSSGRPREPQLEMQEPPSGHIAKARDTARKGGSVDFHVPPNHRDGAGYLHLTRRRGKIASDQTEQRALAGPIATDNAGAFRAEGQVEIG